MKLLAAKKWSKVFHENGEKYRIDVIADLVHRDGNSNAYFAIGGDIFRLAKNGRKVHESGGCIHDDIIKHFPQLQLLVDLHLADEDGVPMHAYENAAYWAGQTKYQALNVKVLAKHLRITQDEANRLTVLVHSYYPENYENAWKNICHHFELTKQWKHQALEAKALLYTTEVTQ
jgi:hypothetical protein